MNQTIFSEFTFLAIPFAGGEEGAYRSISANIPNPHRWLTLGLPGRGTRAEEAPIDDILAMAEDLKSKWSVICKDGPYAIFGHSMGALVAYEMLLLFAKDNARGRTRFAELGTVDFWREMGRYVGLPDSVLKNERWKASNENVMRNDCSAMENYPGRSADHKVSVPLYYRVGERDSIPPEEVDEWRNFSSVSVDIRRIPGDHFFIHSHSLILISVGDTFSSRFMRHLCM